jgi:hypothetical protein
MGGAAINGSFGSISFYFRTPLIMGNGKSECEMIFPAISGKLSICILLKIVT